MLKKVLSIILLFIWKYCCDFLYIKTFTSFQYYGIKFDLINSKLLESYLYLFIISLIFINTKYRNCNLLLLILIIFQYVPLGTYYAYANENYIFFRLISFIYFIVLIFNKIVNFKLKTTSSFEIKISYLPIFLFIGLLVLIATNGLPNSSSFNFLNVYSRREKFNSNSMLEYINSFNLYVITPILLLFSFNFKKPKYFIIAFLYNSFYFLVSGGKYAFFILFLIPIFYFLSKLDTLKSISLITITLISSLLFTFFLSSTYGFDFVFNELYFRTFIVPAWLSFVYVGLFDTSNFYYFSESFSFLGKKNYISSPEYVGDYLFASQGGSFASNGLWGDAFANFGYIGVLIIFIIFLFCIILINSVKTKVDNKLLSAFLAINGFSLINTSLFSALASRGLMIGVIIFIFLKYNERKTTIQFS